MEWTLAYCVEARKVVKVARWKREGVDAGILCGVEVVRWRKKDGIYSEWRRVRWLRLPGGRRRE